MKIFVVDNFDSFTYNLVHYLEELGAEVSVFRNNQVNYEELLNSDGVVLSPGPGIPDEAGELKAVIEQMSGKKPILGVCLGHQAIAEVFGGSILNLQQVHHGVATNIKIDPKSLLYQDVPDEISVGRYHSWVVNQALPDCFKVTGRANDGEIMSMEHTHLNVVGVQYHPESILTPHGKQILHNWLKNFINK